MSHLDNNIALDKEISFICDEIKQSFDVEKIIVFGVKRSEKDNSIVDLDLCIISKEIKNKNAWLKKAYLEIDSDVPYDLFLYTSAEWEECIKQSKSFASRIERKGLVVYEKN